MCADVIARVEQIALQQGQPLLKRGGPAFEWRPGVPMPEAPLDVEPPILMDAPEDYTRGEDFDPINVQDILPVGGHHLTFNDEGNPILEEQIRAHDIIPVENDDFIDNEYDVMEPHVDVDMLMDVPIPQQDPPAIHKEERSVASVGFV